MSKSKKRDGATFTGRPARLNDSFLTQHFEWNGVFRSMSTRDLPFQAALGYSPSEGLSLDYLIEGSETLDASPSISGLLDTGATCTLLGHFSFRDSGRMLGIGGKATQYGRAYPRFMLVGETVHADDTFDAVTFSLTGQQEFFFPTRFVDEEQFSSEPVYEIATKFGKLTVRKTALFSFFAGKLSSVIYGFDTHANEDLDQSFDLIRSRHPSAHLSLKKELMFAAHIEFSSPQTCDQCYTHSVIRHCCLTR